MQAGQILVLKMFFRCFVEQKKMMNAFTTRLEKVAVCIPLLILWGMLDRIFVFSAGEKWDKGKMRCIDGFVTCFV